MTLTLILMRHAKSSWDDPNLDDHDRPLNARGQRSAAALGEWLHDRGTLPDQALVSTAVRTRQTWQGVSAAFKNPPQATFTEALYHPGSARIMEVLRAATGRKVLMIGHNPGFADFAFEILATRPEHPRFIDFPTCATLVAQFDLDGWSDLRWGMGEVEAFTVPRELTGG